MHQWSRDDDREKIIRREFEEEGAFEVHPVHEQNGVGLTVLVTREMTPDGVLGNRIHVIEDRGATRVEVARVLDLCRWTWSGYTEVLGEVGFKEIYSVKEKGLKPREYILNVAVK